jgi:hypothetical protein
MLDQRDIYHIPSCVIAVLLLCGLLCLALRKGGLERSAEMELFPDHLSLLAYTKQISQIKIVYLVGFTLFIGHEGPWGE